VAGGRGFLTGLSPIAAWQKESVWPCLVGSDNAKETVVFSPSPTIRLHGKSNRYEREYLGKKQELPRVADPS